MVRAIAYLAQVVKTLDAYAGLAPPGAAGAAAKRSDAADAALEPKETPDAGEGEPS
jgi:hypothetical protein